VEDARGLDRPGVYHRITHPAAASPELDALCGIDHPARDWASPFRTADLARASKPARRRRLDDLGFQLVDVPTLLRRIP
jgi:hypothetical protein